MELTEIEMYYKKNDEMIYLHGYCDDLKLFGVKISEMNDEKVKKMYECFKELGLIEGGVFND